MPKLNVLVSHHLSQDDALKRIKALLPEVKGQYAEDIRSLNEEWDKNTCRFRISVKGRSISGTLIVNSSEVKLSADIPFIALPFKGKIESGIRERAKTLLA